MKTRSIGILAVCLAAGCSHSKAETQTARRADEPPQATASNSVPHHGAQKQGANGEHERVELPRHHKRGEIASAGHELPAPPARKEQTDKEPAPAEKYGTSADNTRVNERDRSSAVLTPLDQSESEGDRTLTQQIRKAVIADDALSFSAKNVKIITRDGHVTLRGTVKTQHERSAIEHLAREAAGAPGRVTNEIEIAGD